MPNEFAKKIVLNYAELCGKHIKLSKGKRKFGLYSAVPVYSIMLIEVQKDMDAMSSEEIIEKYRPFLNDTTQHISVVGYKYALKTLASYCNYQDAEFTA